MSFSATSDGRDVPKSIAPVAFARPVPPIAPTTRSMSTSSRTTGAGSRNFHTSATQVRDQPALRVAREGEAEADRQVAVDGEHQQAEALRRRAGHLHVLDLGRRTAPAPRVGG